MPIIRKLTRHSGSLEVTVPRDVINQLGIVKGDYVVWAIDKDKRIILEKLSPKKHPGYFLTGSGWLKHGKRK